MNIKNKNEKQKNKIKVKKLVKRNSCVVGRRRERKMIVGFGTMLHSPPIPIAASISKPFHNPHKPTSLAPRIQSQQQNPRIRRRSQQRAHIVAFAEKKNDTKGGVEIEEEEEQEMKKEKPRLKVPGGWGRWRDLVVDPDPDNVLAVGLTGAVAWASVQVLWQLLFISLAILVAALKYSFVAALLLFILITLL